MTAHIAALPTQEPPCNIEAEQAVLGGCFVSPVALAATLAFLKPEHFHEEMHQRVFQAVTDLHGQGKPANPITLRPFLPLEQIVHGISIGQYLVNLAKIAVPSQTAAMGRTLVELYARREMIAALRDGIATLADFPANAQVDEYAAGLASTCADFAQLVQGKEPGTSEGSLADLGEAVFARACDIYKGDAPRPPSSGLRALDTMLPMRGLAGGSLYVIAGRPGMGKAQPTTARVRSPGEWKCIGDLRVGDDICSVDGRPSAVTGVFPQGAKPVYRVTLSDGRTTEACGEHLWHVCHKGWASPKIVTTKQIANLLKRKTFQKRLKVPTHSGDVGIEKTLPLNPWLLGALIGNGTLGGGGIVFSTQDSETLDRIRRHLPVGVNLTRINKFDWRISGNRGEVCRLLQEADLRFKMSYEKRIPREYLDASRPARLEMLRGLMDTDGWVEKQGSARFSTASAGLAQDIVELARSLGFWASQKQAPSYLVLPDGSREQKRDAHYVVITGPHVGEIVSLSRKVERLKNRKWHRAVTITSVEPIGDAECVCISVSHPSSLYITDDYIVTHNTMLAASLARNVAKSGYGVIYASLEVTSGEIAARIMSSIIGLDDLPYGDILSGNLQPAHFELMADAKGAMRPWPLYVNDKPALGMPEIMAACERIARQWSREGIATKLVAVDHAKLVKQPQEARGNSVEALGIIANSAKVLAKRMDATVVLCSQLNRGVEQREDKRPMMSDLRASGELEEAADAVLLLYRPAYYLMQTPEFKRGEPDALAQAAAAFNDLEINVAKARQGAPGNVRLWCNPGTSDVRDRGRA